MTATAAPVDRSTRRLSEAARHVVIPEGIVDSLWYDVAERCEEFGDTFDAWQDGLGEVTLGIRADGTFAATIGGITFSIPRQVAKTFIVMRIVVALCTLFPNLTVIWTAHRMRTATNTFQKMKAYVLRRSVRPYIKAGSNNGTAIRDTNGEQAIPFTNGSQIIFGAREQGFGRGFDEVDIEVFDEAQILTVKALEDMVAATNQSRFQYGALLFYMGTPPRREVDPGDVFTERRTEALASKASAGGDDFGAPVESGDAVYVECSGDPSLDVDDPRQVELANPSYPHRTPPVSVQRLRKNLPDKDSWRREGLGIWDEVVGAKALIDAASWKAGHREIAPPAGVQAFGVKFAPDGQRVSLAGARRPEGGPTHVEVIKAMSTAVGTAELADWVAARWRKAAVIVVDGKAGADQFVTALVKRGVPRRRIVVPTLSQVYEAHSGLLEAVKSGDLTHYGQTGLDDVVKAATKRLINKDGGWGWQAISDDVDVTPLEAVTYAHFGATTTKRKPSGDGERASSSGRRAVVA